jgi:hypothetical protein
MEEDIYYLVHITKNYTKDWTELRTSKVEDYEDQFPGVYLTLITKENIHNVDLYPGKQILIFSNKILEQLNWHINLRDYNGYISEHNTYFPWNLNDAVIKINKNGKWSGYKSIDDFKKKKIKSGVTKGAIAVGALIILKKLFGRK